MFRKMSFITLLLCISYFSNLPAQSSADLNFFSVLSAPKSKNVELEDTSSEDKNEFRNTTILLFSVYKNLISSQDGSTCKFHPTCSAYCKAALIKNGPFLGMIQTFDRLTRCNGLSPRKYQIDMKRRKLVDHVH